MSVPISNAPTPADSLSVPAVLSKAAYLGRGLFEAWGDYDDEATLLAKARWLKVELDSALDEVDGKAEVSDPEPPPRPLQTSLLLSSPRSRPSELAARSK